MESSRNGPSRASNLKEPTVTRLEAAEILGCSKSLLVTFERRGDIHRKSRSNGVIVYDRTEIEVLAERRRPKSTRRLDSGALEARLFVLFNEGVSLEEITRREGHSSDLVLATHERWLAMRGARPGVATPKRRDLDSSDLKRIYDQCDRERAIEQEEDERASSSRIRKRA